MTTTTTAAVAGAALEAARGSVMVDLHARLVRVLDGVGRVPPSSGTCAHGMYLWACMCVHVYVRVRCVDKDWVRGWWA
jgi:hypothetical protein